MPPRTIKGVPKMASHEPPIVFTARDIVPDMRLEIFGKVYHVHSTILSLYSAFFNKFLNPLNKTAQASQVPVNDFKYSWVTKIDESDGSWVLGSATDKLVFIGDFKTFKGKPKEEQIAFEALLLAFYTRPFQLSSFKMLQKMVSLADYYCCLPILSTGLNSALLRSSCTESMFNYQALESLQLARKLRNEIMFREALIYVLGPIENPLFKALPDPELKAYIEPIYNDRLVKIVSTRFDWLKHLGRRARREQDIVTESERHEYDMSFIAELLRDDRLLTGRGRNCTEEQDLDEDEDPDSNCFWCLDIENDHLPWDTSEVDW